jgi:membrane protease YdiL (CAAX protease family)
MARAEVPEERHATVPVEGPDDRFAGIPQYSTGRILAVWVAAALPMALLAWVVAPLLKGGIGGDEPLTEALLVTLTGGLIWQFALVLILMRRELGGLSWAGLRDGLWLRAPSDPRSGRVGGRVWWWLIPFILVFGLEQLIPGIPGPSARDFADFASSDAGEDFFRGAWGWYVVVVVLAVFNTVLGEELLFRGFLLPRMNGAFGRRDWIANGILFSLYHLHVPWVIPTSLVDVVALAYPSRRFQSALMGIVIHSVQSLVILGVVLALVLD